MLWRCERSARYVSGIHTHTHTKKCHPNQPQPQDDCTTLLVMFDFTDGSGYYLPGERGRESPAMTFSSFVNLVGAQPSNGTRAAAWHFNISQLCVTLKGDLCGWHIQPVSSSLTHRVGLVVAVTLSIRFLAKPMRAIRCASCFPGAPVTMITQATSG